MDILLKIINFLFKEFFLYNLSIELYNSIIASFH